MLKKSLNIHFDNVLKIKAISACYFWVSTAAAAENSIFYSKKERWKKGRKNHVSMHDTAAAFVGFYSQIHQV